MDYDARVGKELTEIKEIMQEFLKEEREFRKQLIEYWNQNKNTNDFMKELHSGKLQEQIKKEIEKEMMVTFSDLIESKIKERKDKENNG